MKPEAPIPGEVFRSGREKAGISQKQAAVICDVTLKTVSNWELGKTPCKAAYYWYMMYRTGQV